MRIAVLNSQLILRIYFRLCTQKVRKTSYSSLNAMRLVKLTDNCCVDCTFDCSIVVLYLALEQDWSSINFVHCQCGTVCTESCCSCYYRPRVCQCCWTDSWTVDSVVNHEVVRLLRRYNDVSWFNWRNKQFVIAIPWDATTIMDSKLALHCIKHWICF